MDEAGEIVEEVPVENSNLDDLAQQYAGADPAIENDGYCIVWVRKSAFDDVKP